MKSAYQEKGFAADHLIVSGLGVKEAPIWPKRWTLALSSRILWQTKEKELDRHPQYLPEPEQRAGRNPIGAPFVSLDLLKGDTRDRRKFTLAHA